MIGTCSKGILRIPNLSSFLGEPVSLWHLSLSQYNAICGWGRKNSGCTAIFISKIFNIPYLLLEDGFLRSCGLGVENSPLLSMVVDDLGIYYDANKPSRLELFINSLEFDEALQTQASQALHLICQHRLSKYNHAPEWQIAEQATTKTRILVIDQTKNDMAVRLGGANAKVFEQMLESAIRENPEAEIWVKTHPDVLSGKKQSYLDFVQTNPSIHLLAKNISPLCLLEQVDKVYVVTSQMGFEALMLKKPVICFGLPWYAGWGLTDDRNPKITNFSKRRNVKRTVEELFAAAYLQYARYIDPATGKPGTIFDVIHWLIQHRQANHSIPD